MVIRNEKEFNKNFGEGSFIVVEWSGDKLYKCIAKVNSSMGDKYFSVEYAIDAFGKLRMDDVFGYWDADVRFATNEEIGQLIDMVRTDKADSIFNALDGLNNNDLLEVAKYCMSKIEL